MQCFPKNSHVYILILIILLYETFATLSILDKGLVSLHNNSIGIQFYIDIENKNKISECVVHSWVQDCCLTDGEDDCNTMLVHGGDYILMPRDRATVLFVYPSLYQHDQVGYCNFWLDYQCDRNKRSKRQKVDVAFDTRINVKSTAALTDRYVAGETKSTCDTLDQDSLLNCEPVNCDMKYSGEKSYYDGYTGKCTEAPICESNPDSELPDVVYVPDINACRDLEHPLTVGDIFAISTGTGVVTQHPAAADEVTVAVQSNCSTISQNLKLLRDLMYGKLCPVLKSDVTAYSECCKTALLAIITYIGGVCALLFSLLCCIQTVFWLQKKIAKGEMKNFLQNFKGMFKSPNSSRNYYEPTVNSDVRKTLLREVIIRDIPMELRDSIVNICERMDKKVKRKKRYRSKDIGSQINLNQVQYDVRTSTATSSSSASESCDERHKLMK